MLNNATDELAQVIAQIRRVKLNLSGHVLVFILSTLIIVLLPGPTYYAGFLFLFIVLSFFYHQDLTRALFHSYLLVFFFERPFFYLNLGAIQEYFYYETPKMLFLPNSIPVRFIIFVFLVFLVFINQKSKNNNSLKIKGHFLRAMLASLLILFLLSINQIFGAYRIQYGWQFIHLFQIFLTFPVISIFILQRSRNTRVLESIRLLIGGFIIASLVIQGAMSVAQFTVRSRLDLRIEHTQPALYTSEENIFRSAGTFSFPNYLGVNASMLLLFPILTVINSLAKKKVTRFSKEGRKVFFWGIVSVIAGFFALVLNFSRWVWISFISTLAAALFIRKKLFIKELEKMDKRQKRILFGGVFILTIVLLAALALRLRSVGTFMARIESAKQTVSLIETYPIFGVGPGLSGLSVAAVEKDYEKYMFSLKGAHNTLLYIAADNGLVLTLAFIVFIVVTLFQFFKYIDLFRENWFILSLALAFILFLLNSLAYPLYTFDTSLELFLLFTSVFFVFSDKIVRLRYKKV